MKYQIISTSPFSLSREPLIWYTGTEQECKSVLPRMQSMFCKTSDEFKIIKK